MFIQVIMGPRQIGKSTVIRQVLEDLDKPSLFYSADTIPSTSSTWISECWANARLQMRAQGQEEMILVIDEIQKLKNWSEYVKKEWDTDSLNRINLKVALLSPSRVLLEKGLAESLMGRYEEVRMSHWSYPEMQEAFGFTLEQYIYYGGYPRRSLPHQQRGAMAQLCERSHRGCTINKDILMDSPISKPALLRQTFELSVAYSGKILSLTKMLGTLQDAGDTVTLAGYLNLLGDSGLVTGLQKFSMDMARKRASIPKYQVYNNALLSVQMGLSYREALADNKQWGQIF